jgi:hypothetical protein
LSDPANTTKEQKTRNLHWSVESPSTRIEKRHAHTQLQQDISLVRSGMGTSPAFPNRKIFDFTIPASDEHVVPGELLITWSF